MAMKKIPYDSDNEEVPRSPGFKAEAKVMNQNLPA